jgi:hypothetical protein
MWCVKVVGAYIIIEEYTTKSACKTVCRELNKRNKERGVTERYYPYFANFV